MKPNQIKLVSYLLEQNNPVTSTVLAKQLQISVRTIKNYVNEINLQGKTKVILSTNSGYQVNRELAKQLLMSEKSDIPQNYLDRSFYIIKKLLIEHRPYLDLYELCETLYISYSTLKLDITKMNQAYSNFHISFVCKNDQLRILGEEKHKRKLISHFLFEEANHKFIDLTVLKSCFHEDGIDKLNQIIHSIFRKYNYYINDFSLSNIILHLMILIDRVLYGNSIQSKSNIKIEDEIERALVNDISESLESAFNLCLNENEKFEIYMLFKTNANQSLSKNMSDLKKIVGDDILNITHKVITSVNEVYLIDLLNDTFLIPFALHLKNLFERSKNNSFTKNPMVENIRKQCPTIYDIGIYISLQLKKLKEMEIPEDEIAFIALHIGAEIERKKVNDEKIRCVILCPEYMGMQTKLYNEILINFSNHLNIISVVSFPYQLETLKFDLLITTIKVDESPNYKIFTISPFAIQINKKKMYSVLDEIQQNAKNCILRKKFHYFFNKDLFFLDPVESSKEDLIKNISKLMQEQGCVNDEYLHNVLEREKASSTAFCNIAIPHSVHMNAIKTTIAVVISKNGFRWGESHVNIVLMIAINKIDKKIFRELYEALIALFTDSSIGNIVKNCNCFNDFESLFYSSTETNKNIS